MTLCREVSSEPVPGWRHEHGAWRCPVVGISVRLPCPAGRPDAVGGPYCDTHGGADRARAEAARDWGYLAPASVGDSAAVMAAGNMVLQTPHAYVVVRPEGDHWLAWLGLGSRLAPVRDPGRLTSRQRRAVARGQQEEVARETAKQPGGSAAFPSRQAALERAMTAWRSEVEARVAQIRTARGGTLEWGAPVAPLADPIVVEIGEHGSAWDVAVQIERRAPEGLALISGLRPSGEAS